VIVELGKYYKTREGITMGPMVVNKDDYEYPFRCESCGKSYAPNGRYYKFEEDPLDLVRECTAGESLVLSSPLTADRSWRDEIALRVLPALLTDFLKDVRIGSVKADVGASDPQWAVVCQEAFAIADVFIKVSIKP
jgi:hypothetical protein